MTGNVDGSISVYNMKKTSEPQQKTSPHGQGPCRPINAIDWKYTADGDQFVIFSGGMPTEDGLPVPALTFLRASKSATVLEMERPILSFVTLPNIPFPSCPQQPQALAVLLKGELMVLDLLTPGYPSIEPPHALDLHEVPITCVAYYSDCASDLIGALTLVGCKQRRKGFSERAWPISGGIARECATGHQELILTGHKDGSVRFWQASGENLQFLYRLKTTSHFERLEEWEGCEKVSHAVKSIELCVEVVHIPQSSASSSNTADERLPPVPPPREIRRQKKVVSRDSTNSPDTSDASGDECIFPFKVRGAPVKRSAGYQVNFTPIFLEIRIVAGFPV
ncbi:LLGL2 protein [Cooperia oncophora]